MRHELREIGSRLARVRGHASQAAFATTVGLHKNTLGTYERGEREPGALALLSYCRLGWNVNWLLTGEGPERLEALQGQAFSDSGQAPASPSHSVRQDDIKLAVQLLREAEQAAGRPPRWTPEQQGEATAILVRLLEIGLATAEVSAIANKQIRLVSGGQQDEQHGSRTKGIGR